MITQPALKSGAVKAALLELVALALVLEAWITSS